MRFVQAGSQRTSVCASHAHKKTQAMPEFYFLEEGHTLASALRAALEASVPDEYVAVTRPHPLDNYLEVTAPSEAALREALLTVKAQVDAARVVAA
jgi:DNA-directed RNA polymerase subunit L